MLEERDKRFGGLEFVLCGAVCTGRCERDVELVRRWRVARVELG